MQEVFTLEELSKLLENAPQKLRKAITQGKIASNRVKGELVFSLADVVLWLENELNRANEQDIKALESAMGRVTEAAEEEPLFEELLSPSLVTPLLQAKTKSSVLREMTKLAESSGMLWDAKEMEQKLKDREELASTATKEGIAILHPPRPQPNIIAGDFLAVGKMHSGIPFGGDHGVLTDVFFLLCCQTHENYLRRLSRLARIVKTPEFLPMLRELDDAESIVDLLKKTNETLDVE